MSDLLLRFVIITLCISAISSAIFAGVGWGFYLSLKYGVNQFAKPLNKEKNETCIIAKPK
jgi:hypothetical protein